MAWQLVVGLNLLISVCYVIISALILMGLARTRQVRANRLALATALIFASCAVHHWAHALHLLIPEGGGGQAGLEATRQTYSGVHNVLIEVFGAAVAVTYLGLRRNYTNLLNTSAMFDDAVRAAAEERLRALAFTDPLTQVANRASYQAYADGIAAEPGPVAVLFIDLDGFKEINDRHGHDAGDRLLREVARRLDRGLGPGERLFRIGGDEFVVIAVGTQVDDVAALLARVEAIVAAPFTVREGLVTMTASIGVATSTSCATIDQLLREADVQMYRVKDARHAAAAGRPAAGPSQRVTPAEVEQLLDGRHEEHRAGRDDEGPPGAVDDDVGPARRARSVEDRGGRGQDDQSGRQDQAGLAGQ